MSEPQQQDPPPPQQEPKKPLGFTVVKETIISEKCRFCPATGKAISDDESENGIYYAPKIKDIEEQTVKNTRDLLVEGEACQKKLEEIDGDYEKKLEMVQKVIGEMKEEVEKIAKEGCEMIEKWKNGRLDKLESESEKVKEEYASIKLKSEELSKDIKEKNKSIEDVLSKVENREINGDEGMEQLYELTKELEKCLKVMEGIEEKACVDYEFHFTPRILFDNVFDFSNTKDTLVTVKSLGRDYIEAEVSDQKGEHEELVYTPDDKFPVKCEEDGHDMSKLCFLDEKDKKWYCFMCEKDGAKRYDKIRGEKKTKLDDICKKIEENCGKLKTRNDKNAENEKTLNNSKIERKKEIDEFFINEHKRLEEKRTEVLGKLEHDFNEAFSDIMKEHERLRLYLKKGNHLLGLAKKTARDYEWASAKPKMTYKPIEQLINDVEYLGDKSATFDGKIATLENDSKNKFMKIDFVHPDGQKIEEGVRTISVNVTVIPEQ